MTVPILYSFRRCPYAMRARMALAYSKCNVELREVLLKDKPPALLQASAKATVPVLVLENKKVIDESIDIMHWALSKYDPDHWLIKNSDNPAMSQEIINENDSRFKRNLDRYKYSDRYPDYTAEYYRSQGEIFLLKLESLLSRQTFLHGETAGLVDIAVFPFVRQFAYVDINWFENSNYPYLHAWLDFHLNSDLFKYIMKKHSQWNPDNEVIII